MIRLTRACGPGAMAITIAARHRAITVGWFGRQFVLDVYAD